MTGTFAVVTPTATTVYVLSAFNPFGLVTHLSGNMGVAHLGPDGARSPAQVALNWTLCKGALAIPGAKNAQQVQQNAGALGWRLTADEVAELDELSQSIQIA